MGRSLLLPASAIRFRNGLLREPEPLSLLTRRRSYPWLVVGTTCIAAFIGQVDASIVQLALPELERAFGAHLDTVCWVAIAYVLAFAAALPVFARLAENGGRKLMYMLGFFGFGVWSALCGLAPGIIWLIGFRVLQGICGAMLGANSIVILVAVAGPERRGRAMGLFAGAQAVGISAGPVLGGLLLSTLSWHWIFWVSVPFSLAGAVAGRLVIPVTAHVAADTYFDWRGAMLLVPALIALLLAINELDAWGVVSLATLACVAATLVLLTRFVWQERRVRSPLLDLALFRSPAFSGGVIAVLLSYAMLYGMFFTMSFALVRGYHDAPLAAGLRLTIIPIALGIVAPISGALSERWTRLVLTGGMALCVVALVFLRMVLTGTPGSLSGVMLALALYGAGLGLFIAPNNSVTLGAAPSDKSGVAGGLLNLMCALGTGTGVAAAGSMLSWRLDRLGAPHLSTVGADEAAVLSAIGDVLVMLAAFAVIAGIVSSFRSGDGRRRRRPVPARAVWR